MFNRFLRTLRHRWTDESHRTFSDASLRKLQALIAASESQHSGEIRLCIESGLPNSYLLRADAMPELLRQRALAQFGRLRVWDTEHNNGVLIYLCLAEHAIELVADRGVHRRVAPGHWGDVVSKLGSALSKGDVEGGLAQAVQEVSTVLSEHFPLKRGDVNVNELPDSPVVL
jgi:uncharacterized membrane protein